MTDPLIPQSPPEGFEEQYQSVNRLWRSIETLIYQRNQAEGRAERYGSALRDIENCSNHHSHAVEIARKALEE